MQKLLTLTVGCCLLFSCTNSTTEQTTKDTASTTPSASTASNQATEIADDRYMERGKKGLKAMAAGDIDAWMEDFADDAIYYWSAGDSLAGRTAIANYWKNRRSKIIDSMSYAEDIWLPVKVNRPQGAGDLPGIWLLGWYNVTTKYKNGAKLSFWVHSDFHYNSADKIDRIITYIDRAPINKALGLTGK